ncbi:MAG: sigma-70 family RNA polymerase sigma factor [Planctomycetota bacterium]|nr:sigma-70 family RNA polymerase sigma factor [Planctomycetota bacterium]
MDYPVVVQVSGLHVCAELAPAATPPLSSSGRKGEAERAADIVLAARVARRDGDWTQALEQLFLKHAPALLHFSARFLRNDAEAEDLVHDVFVQAAQTVHTYRGESPFRTWLFSLAINLARSRQRRWRLEDRASRSIAAPKVKRESDPAWNLEQRELREKVDEAIGALTDAERETFLLYWFGELTYAEISGITGLSVSAAKVRVHRALARLGKMLEGMR